jgi:hypothetical protein
MHNFSNLFYFGTTLYMFRTVFPSIIRSLRLYIQHKVYNIQVLWLLASKQPQKTPSVCRLFITLETSFCKIKISPCALWHRVGFLFFWGGRRGESLGGLRAYKSNSFISYYVSPSLRALFVEYEGELGARCGAVVWGTALQVGRSRVRFPMASLEFFIDIILPAALWLSP